MQKTKPDRRIGRTRQLLHQALIDLILENGYESITVQDILDRANVGRSTFYAHYRDKEDLLLGGFQVLVETFQSQVEPHGRGSLTEEAGRELSLGIFRHAASHQPLFKAMLGRQGGEVVMRYASSYLSQVARAYITTLLGGRKPRIPEDLLVHYLVSSFLSLLTWWLDEGFSLSPEEINQAFWDLAIPGLVTGLQG